MRRPLSIEDLNHIAYMELLRNQSITVYEFRDGKEVNRHHPLPWTRARVAFARLGEAVVNAGKAFEQFGEAFRAQQSEQERINLHG